MKNILKRLGILCLCVGVIVFLGLLSNCKKDKDPIITPPEVILPTRVTIGGDKTNLKIYIGDTYQIHASITPSDATQSFTYHMADETIATVTETGLVTGLSEGIAHITVKAKEDTGIFATVSISILHPLLETDTYEAFGIATAPGEDANHGFNIHYQIKNTKSIIEYTLASDTEFKDATKVLPENGYYFEDVSGTTISEFPARNVYNTYIDGLEEKTTYIYRINQGNDTYSPTYTYTTSGGDSTDFIWLTDNHYYSDNNTDGSEGFLETKGYISEQTISEALKINPNINFVLHSGDLIDRGGSNASWNFYYQKAFASHSKLGLLATPGNHEYYIYGTGQGDQRYFVANMPAPQNGPSSKMGDSCYIVSNGCLIVMLDNCKLEGIDEQIAWLDNVLATADYKFSIVSMHYPLGTATLNKVFSNRLYEVFEKYSVDLALEGHMHSESYVSDYYEHQVSNDPLLGTTYYIGEASSALSSSTATLDENLNKTKGYIVKVTGGTCVITKLNGHGTILDTKTIISKRNKEVIPATNEELINSMANTIDKENLSTTFSWSNKFYGNVDKVEITETLRNEINYEIVIPTPGYTKKIVTGLKDGYDYHFKVTVTFKDKTTKEFNYPVNFSDDISLSATYANNTVHLSYTKARDSFQFTIKLYKIYIDGVYITSVNYLNALDEVITSKDVTVTEKPKTIKLVSCNYEGNIIFTKEVTIA